MMRLGKDSVSLAPMYIVWNTYNEKADKYVRMHGCMNFAQAYWSFYKTGTTVNRRRN